MEYQCVISFLLILNACSGFANDAAFITQTVYGFLDFTTTIGNTVMVFSPQSAPALDINFPANIIETKPTNNNREIIKPTKLPISNSNIKSSTLHTTKKNIESSSFLNNTISVGKSISKVLPVENNLYQPGYDLLSRQPAEYAEETYRLVNLKPNLRQNRRPHVEVANTSHPLGLVTKLKETELKGDETTIHETSVLGTYISGKYAQVLQSSSNIYRNQKAKIRPTPSLRILKTSAPLPLNSGSNVSRHRKKPSNSPENNTVPTPKQSADTPTGGKKKPQSRNKSKRKNKSSRASSLHQSSLAAASSSQDLSGRRSLRLKIQPSTAEPESSNSVYQFKLNRTPGRWQYKTSPKPRVNIRKHSESATSTSLNNFTSAITSISTQDANSSPNENTLSDQDDLESLGSQDGAILNNLNQENNKNFVETLNVDISTPPNFIDTYYEIATIKTPFTFQAGLVKKTRFITVTSTYEKTLQPEPTSTVAVHGPLMENILAQTTRDQAPIDGSISTLQAIYLTDSLETPSLETITESFTVTQMKYKTQVLPIIREYANVTSYLTLVQTYDYTSLITVTKTLSPLETDQFIASKSFKDFGGSLDEAGSEINLELEFGDEDNRDILSNKQLVDLGKSEVETPLNLKKDLNPKNTPSLSPIVNINTDPVSQLGLFNLFNQQSTVITKSYPVIIKETVWESHVVPLVNGLSTIYRTLSKSVGVVDKTEYKLDTTTVALPSALPTVNPFLLPVPQQYHTLTSSIVHQTSVTQTNSKVLKLTFGAKTAYTTLFSTQVVPTYLTMLITTSLPVQPTAAFPGYFPQPYPPFPYVG